MLVMPCSTGTHKHLTITGALRSFRFYNYFHAPSIVDRRVSTARRLHPGGLRGLVTSDGPLIPLTVFLYPYYITSISFFPCVICLAFGDDW
jgi:hypothetical protein